MAINMFVALQPPPKLMSFRTSCGKLLFKLQNSLCGPSRNFLSCRSGLLRHRQAFVLDCPRDFLPRFGPVQKLTVDTCS